MKNLSKREKIMLITASVLLVLYGYFRLLLLPVITEIQVTTKNINKYTEELNSQNSIKLISQNNKNQLEELKSKIQETLKALPESERNPEIAYKVKVLGDKSGVDIDFLSFESAQIAKQDEKNSLNELGIIQVPLTVQVIGEYKNILNFINSIENDNRIAEVDRVEISGEDSKLKASISFSYLYMEAENKKDVQYDFNKGNYGKEDLFK
ncbi:type 4a pilus biogenesis protein PilO [Clostridium sp. SYSU_GA19001]|uniref:type 4a pilus biogenesis protein PilO n=1 Tax=Clostridium caldaquaticum TaxID=2940653 RepID=UPI0020778184|nr:type 4a pilus biogenesis protein PilO [Clostridium caldaquaticum]MCM8711513.1 type 4a pilus biogenesis protein PilO [Clostridium caldaquaticum]